MKTDCLTARWRLTQRHLLLEAYPAWNSFTLGCVPIGFPELVRQVHPLAGLSCHLRFVWLQHAQGMGGFFTPGLVAMGHSDLIKIAERVKTYLRRIPGQNSFYFRAGGQLVSVSESQIWNAVIQYVLAHELGHAVQSEAGWRLPSVTAECDADTFAGKVACSLGWDARLQRLVAYAVGCLHMFCTHPSPNERVACYDRGYAFGGCLSCLA